MKYAIAAVTLLSLLAGCGFDMLRQTRIVSRGFLIGTGALIIALLATGVLIHVSASADKDGIWFSEIDELKLRFHLNRAAQTVTVQSEPHNPSQPIVVMYAFWFAWYATHPNDEVVVR